MLPTFAFFRICKASHSTFIVPELQESCHALKFRAMLHTMKDFSALRTSESTAVCRSIFTHSSSSATVFQF